VIVRERADSFVLVEQHEHALVSGEFAWRWAERPVPLGSTLYAVENHDVGWQELDGEVLWNEASGRPHSFVDHPLGPKLEAWRRGIERVEARDAYAGCLCSMHYARFLVGSENPGEAVFLERERARQGRLREGMSGEELEKLERNFRFLRRGSSGTRRRPPTGSSSTDSGSISSGRTGSTSAWSRSRSRGRLRSPCPTGRSARTAVPWVRGASGFG